jgi:hypothetical protein
MWRKLIGPDWNASLRLLTPDQRWAIQLLARQLERDPSDRTMRPVILADGRRELETAGVWVRYELRERTREIVFIKASKL